MDMSEGSPTEQIVRARAVADAPIEQLLARVEELARRWVIAEFATRPLREIGDVPLAQLARDAPALCEQLVRALGSDAELARLLSGEEGSSHERVQAHTSATRVLALAASDASSVVASVESLRSVLWRQTLAELRDPPTTLVVDLADRLAFVCASILAATLAASAGERDMRASDRLDTASERSPRVARRAGAYAPARGGAVLIDELDDPPRRESPPRLGASPETAGETPRSSARQRARARPWDTPLHSTASEEPASLPGATAAREVPLERDSELRVRRASRVPVDELR
jgi:hypothetical protein